MVNTNFELHEPSMIATLAVEPLPESYLKTLKFEYLEF